MDEWKKDLPGNKLKSEGELSAAGDLTRKVPDPAIDPTIAREHMKNLTKQVAPEETLAGMVVEGKYGEEVQYKIREFRVQIDSLYLTADAMTRAQPAHGLQSRELSLAVTAFQQARQFCGKILQERGSVKPYTAEQSDRVDKGAPIAEIVDAENGALSLTSLRDKAEEVIINFSIYMQKTEPVSLIEVVSNNAVLTNLISAKMWLGELYAIKKNSKN